MELLKLAIVFVFILVLIRFKLQLWIVLAAAAVFTGIIFLMPPLDFLKTIGLAAIDRSTYTLVLAMYFVLCLNEAMSRKNATHKGVTAMASLFNNRRLNAMVIPIFMALLPTGGAVFLSAPFVKEAAGDYFKNEESAVVNNYYRHTSEMWLPTYAGVLLAAQVSGISVSSYMIWSFPMLIVMLLIGYLFYIRKLPKDTGVPRNPDRKQDVRDLFGAMWPILVIMFIVLTGPILLRGIHSMTGVLLLGGKLDTFIATAIALLAYLLIHRFSLKDILDIMKKGFKFKTLSLIFVTMIFRGVVESTNVVDSLPALIKVLPIPAFLVFALIFLFTSMLTGSMSAIIAMGLPLAFATVPGAAIIPGEPISIASIALLVLLNIFAFAGNLMTPTHMCNVYATEYFKVDMGNLVKRNVQMYVPLCVVTVLYYLLLVAIF